VGIVSLPSNIGHGESQTLAVRTPSPSQFAKCFGLNLLDLLFGQGELLPNLF